MVSDVRVLIVDDEPETLDSFTRMLSLEGYSVVSARNGEEALSCARARRPGAIIVDLRMPVVDGERLLERVRRCLSLATIPTAIVTGDYLIDEGTIDRLSRLGAQVVFKPLWLEDVVSLVVDLVSAGSQTQGAGACDDQRV